MSDWPQLERERGCSAAEGAVLRVAAAVADGTCDRRPALAVEAWGRIRSLRDPVALVRRARRRATEKRCIIRRTIAEQDRRVPADREAWLRAVAESHAVYHDAPLL
jgi:hypothetical protein